MKTLTIQQIAEILQVSRPTVYELMKREDNPIPHTRISKYSIRFIEEDVKRWLDTTCRSCGSKLRQEAENNGFDGVEGPTHYENTGKFKCTFCDN